MHLVLSKYQFEAPTQNKCTRSLENCPQSEFKHGDGFCDDDMNIIECDFDGQDCCKENIIDYFCSKCECIKSGCEDDISKLLLIIRNIRAESSVD